MSKLMHCKKENTQNIVEINAIVGMSLRTWCLYYCIVKRRIYKKMLKSMHHVNELKNISKDCKKTSLYIEQRCVLPGHEG